MTVDDLRVRDLGDTVRIEVDPALVERVCALPGLRRTVTEAGFGDLPQRVEPFRSGRLNSETAARTEP
jgi:uncharacterized protein